MKTALQISGVSVDLSSVVATCDDEGVCAWRGPVVFTCRGETTADMWLGEGLDGSAGPDVDDAAWLRVAYAIARTIEMLGDASLSDVRAADDVMVKTSES